MKLREYYECLFAKLPKENTVSNEGSKQQDIVDIPLALFSEELFFGIYNNSKHGNSQSENNCKNELKQYKVNGSEVDITLSKLLYTADFIKQDSKYEDFAKARRKLFERLASNSIIDIMNDNNNKVIENYLNAYQNLLIYMLHHLANCKLERERAEIKQFLNKFMLIDCLKDYKENNINISWLNPIMLVQLKRICALKHVISKYDNEQNQYQEILSKLVAIIMEKQLPSKFYSTIVIYTIDKKNCTLDTGFQIARPRGTMSTISSVNSVRIIGKILRALESKKNAGTFKIAYFGEFSDEKKDDNKLNVERYFELEDVKRECNSLCNNLFSHLILDQYSIIIPIQENLIYCKKPKSEQDSEQSNYVDLQEMSSLEELMKSYDMVLFLDEGYYYGKEHQDRRMSFDDLNAIQSFIAQKYEQSKNCLFKWDTLTAWMNWAFSYWSGMSGNYGFDENLYDNICNVSDICSVSNNTSGENQVKRDAYIYISEGEKVGEVDLTKSNVCEEELYYGHKMIVSHFPKKTRLEGLEILLKNREPDFKIRIEAWKLFRSLHDESYEYLYNTIMFEDEKDKYREHVTMIYYLRHITIIWDYRNLVLNSNDPHEIRLEIVLSKCLQDKINMDNLKDFILFIFKIAFSKEQNVISQYVYEVIKKTIRASAYHVEDFLFVNFLKYFNGQCKISFVQTNSSNSKTDSLPSEDNTDGKGEQRLSTSTRQAVHAIVDQLANLHLREVLRDGLYIKRDIIRSIESSYKLLSIEQFDKILQKMKNIEDMGFYSDSLLKHNIDILCPC